MESSGQGNHGVLHKSGEDDGNISRVRAFYNKLVEKIARKVRKSKKKEQSQRDDDQPDTSDLHHTIASQAGTTWHARMERRDSGNKLFPGSDAPDILAAAREKLRRNLIHEHNRLDREGKEQARCGLRVTDVATAGMAGRKGRTQQSVRWSDRR